MWLLSSYFDHRFVKINKISGYITLYNYERLRKLFKGALNPNFLNLTIN